MKINFFKYQGTGNDFIIIDNRDDSISLQSKQIISLCNRRFGIGADGLMLLNSKPGYDFEMKYYNSDGKEGSMCGNGGRCLVKFAYDVGIRKSEYLFSAIDGDHEAEIDTDGIVSLKMTDVNEVKMDKADFILNTGSPHYIKQVDNVETVDVYRKGRDIRYNDEFAEEGINVNFVELKDEDELYVRTYERGVENETFSCGTGVTAAAIAFFHNEKGYNNVVVKTKGGTLSVEYDRISDHEYRNIWLNGPAEMVYEGLIEL
ncbi:MAG: diaminopimelate epimerase [Flavitalea sp.]